MKPKNGDHNPLFFGQTIKIQKHSLKSYNDILDPRGRTHAGPESKYMTYIPSSRFITDLFTC